MVEIKIKIPDEDYFTRRAISVKEVPSELRYPHARNCAELKEQENCKLTVEKKLTKSQSEIYNMILLDGKLRDKDREYNCNWRVKKGKLKK